LTPKLWTLDNRVPPLPFKNEVYEETLKKKLIIGYYDELTCFPATASVKRAMELAKKSLIQQGHTLVKIEIPLEECREFLTIFYKCIAIGSMGQLVDECNKRYERPMHFYKDIWFYWLLPRLFKELLLPIVKLAMGRRVAAQLSCFREFDTMERDDIYRAKIKYELKFKQRWQENKLDAMICPANFHSAYKI
jgi:Asp-tRNA(Asn)/Glu-tRNA(Gln) amidotransferase A subunit family amidase